MTRRASGVRREMGSVLQGGTSITGRRRSAKTPVNGYPRSSRRTPSLRGHQTSGLLDKNINVLHVNQAVAVEAIFCRISRASVWARRAAVCTPSIGDFMLRVRTGFRVAVFQRVAVPAIALFVGIGAAIAQSGDLRAQDTAPKQAAPADAAKESKRKADEFVEAAQAINGPAGNPECVWLGRRVVSLMWRDDLDTAFRHLDLYERFGCPGGHIQATFRCVVRFGATIDPKVAETLTGRVHACWINPASQPQAAAASPPPAAPAAAATPPAPAAAPAPAAPAK